MNCLHCSADTSDAGGIALCSRCQRTVRTAALNVAGYHRDLLDVGAGPAGLRVRGGSADPTGALVLSHAKGDPIAELADATKADLVGWVRALLEDRPTLRWPRDDVASLAQLLAQQVKTIATLPWAGSFARELLVLERRLRRVIEANKACWYAGVCGAREEDLRTVYDVVAGCQRVLYADPASGFVRCPVCRTNWEVRERRAFLLDQARDEVTNVATIARAVVTLLDDQPSAARLEARIQKWVERGKTERRGSLDIDGRVRKVYRLGDVLDMLTIGVAGRSV